MLEKGLVAACCAGLLDSVPYAYLAHVFVALHLLYRAACRLQQVVRMVAGKRRAKRTSGTNSSRNVAADPNA
jgi:hypothetical protein